MIKIYDGNNWYRKLLETDVTGLAPRTLLGQMMEEREPVVFVWDGKYGSSLRRKIYPEYKRNRKPLEKDIYAGFDVAQEVLRNTKAIQVTVDQYEADDVIATLARKFAGEGNQVGIFSNDFDFVQLTNEFPDNIFTGARLKPEVPAADVRYYKTVVGDTSDNIPGIRGFGDGSWASIDRKTLRAWVDAVVQGLPLPSVDMPKRCQTWLEEHLDMIPKFWEIIGFYSVPQKEIDRALVVGQPDYNKIDKYLRNFFL